MRQVLISEMRHVLKIMLNIQGGVQGWKKLEGENKLLLIFEKKNI